MKRASVTIPADLQAALETYLSEQDARPALTAVVRAALREFLSSRGYAPPKKALRVTPARKGSAKSDVALEHDRHFAGR